MEELDIAHEILAYLADHPDAHDTIDGIVQWWLPQQEIRYRKEIVKEALEELVARGLVIEIKSGDSGIHYRKNQNRLREIRCFLGNNLRKR